MANTYSQIYIQIVFAVAGRENLISAANREELHKYISGIVDRRGQKMLSIFCMPDHAHILVGMRPSISVSDLTRDIKAGSSNFINDKRWAGAISIGKRDWGVLVFSQPDRLRLQIHPQPGRTP